MMKETKIKDVIAQAEKELEKTICRLERSDYEGTMIEIKQFISTYTKDLLQSVVEMAGGMKKKTIENMLQEDELFNEKGIDGVRGYDQALSDIINNIQKE